jgi:hypothetical protein
MLSASDGLRTLPGRSPRLVAKVWCGSTTDESAAEMVAQPYRVSPVGLPSAYPQHESPPMLFRRRVRLLDEIGHNLSDE